jgi:uncharacterized damage-inducible protein DinB
VTVEREYLDKFLDIQREALIDAVSGLTDEQSRAKLVSSLTTPIALVKHAAAAERSWFQRTISGWAPERFTGYARGDDASFEVPEDQTLAQVIDEFRQASAVSREIAATHDLDEEFEHWRLGDVSMRFIYLHMIRELARHAGHADILVEQLTRPITGSA